MDFGTALSIGGALLGGLSSSKGQSQTTTRELDPRIAQYVYGQDGLIPTSFDLYKKQMAQGGLNDIQRQGLGMQQQFLQSPEYRQGFDMMRQMGTGLLGAGVAGNPFMQGGLLPRTQIPARQAAPTQTTQPAMVAPPDYTMKPETQAPSPNGLMVTLDPRQAPVSLNQLFGTLGQSDRSNQWTGANGTPDRDTMMRFYNDVERLNASLGGGGDSGPGPLNPWELTGRYFGLSDADIAGMTGWQFDPRVPHSTTARKAGK